MTMTWQGFSPAATASAAACYTATQKKSRSFQFSSVIFSFWFKGKRKSFFVLSFPPEMRCFVFSSFKFHSKHGRETVAIQTTTIATERNLACVCVGDNQNYPDSHAIFSAPEKHRIKLRLFVFTLASSSFLPFQSYSHRHHLPLLFFIIISISISYTTTLCICIIFPRFPETRWWIGRRFQLQPSLPRFQQVIIITLLHTPSAQTTYTLPFPSSAAFW